MTRGVAALRYSIRDPRLSGTGSHTLLADGRIWNVGRNADRILKAALLKAALLCTRVN